MSACLAGIACRYDDRARPHDVVMDAVRRDGAVPLCAEQLGDIYDGAHTGRLVTGSGVTAALLIDNGIMVDSFRGTNL